jgi:hypothetical protein
MPASNVKNREDPLMVLSSTVAEAVVEEMRSAHPEYVFLQKETNQKDTRRSVVEEVMRAGGVARREGSRFEAHLRPQAQGRGIIRRTPRPAGA